MHRRNNFYIQAPPVLEQMTRSNLQLPPFEVMGKVPKDSIHLSGTVITKDKKSTTTRKLQISFWRILDDVTDMDTAGGDLAGAGSVFIILHYQNACHDFHIPMVHFYALGPIQ